MLKKAVMIGSAYSVFNNGNNKLQARNKEENTTFFWGNKNIKDGVTDMIALGRQSLADPLLPKKYLEGREDEIKWCTACDNCIEFLIRQKNVGLRDLQQALHRCRCRRSAEGRREPQREAYVTARRGLRPPRGLPPREREEGSAPFPAIPRHSHRLYRRHECKVSEVPHMSLLRTILLCSGSDNAHPLTPSR